MAALKQGQVHWADLPGPAGRRPVLVLTRTDLLRRLTNVTVAPLTRTIRGLQSEVVLTEEDGFEVACAVSLDNILTIRNAMLERRVAALSPARMAEVFEAVRFTFAMPP